MAGALVRAYIALVCTEIEKLLIIKQSRIAKIGLGEFKALALGRRGIIIYKVNKIASSNRSGFWIVRHLLACRVGRSYRILAR